MSAAGLKSHIALTLVLLLAACTLLANLVITMFWEQTLIRAEIHKIETALSLEARDLAAGSPDHDSVNLPAAARSLLAHLGAECVIILDARGTAFSADSDCGRAVEITRAIRDSVAARSPVILPLGTTWSLFAVRPGSLLIAVPFQDTPASGGIGALTSLSPLFAQVRQKQKSIFVYLLVNILLLSTIGFFRLVKSTVRPVENLVHLAEAHNDAGDLLLLPDREANEFGQLSAAMNRMTRRIDDDRKRLRETVASLESANARLQKAQQDMIRAEKLAAVGRLSAGLAHEIGNPIGIIQGYLELLQRENLSPADRRQFSERAIGELDRINRLIRQLLDFARTTPPGTHPVAMHELIRLAADMFKNRRKMDAITFQLQLNAEHDLVKANEESIRQVLLNCLLNSVDAIGERGENFPGEIILATRNREEGVEVELEISIRDNGCGIDPAQLNNIFDPFFTTKEPGRGTGLGLAVSLAIVEAAGGRIEVESEINKGTELLITFPCSG